MGSVNGQARQVFENPLFKDVVVGGVTYGFLVWLFTATGATPAMAVLLAVPAGGFVYGLMKRSFLGDVPGITGKELEGAVLASFLLAALFVIANWMVPNMPTVSTLTHLAEAAAQEAVNSTTPAAAGPSFVAGLIWMFTMFLGYYATSEFVAMKIREWFG